MKSYEEFGIDVEAMEQREINMLKVLKKLRIGEDEMENREIDTYFDALETLGIENVSELKNLDEEDVLSKFEEIVSECGVDWEDTEEAVICLEIMNRLGIEYDTALARVH